ncbi:hypothetical protein OGATHE_001301 [Ogataea polymorpha]|uniref:Uncharacterized protein n=1 Tax=Ogataea polymorpha TaxID=460523 RepID=A0A9P8PRA8_9ASCO|nr:hypothetical protein OGATHE_001301 [Ogataea polymorpha]
MHLLRLKIRCGFLNVTNDLVNKWPRLSLLLNDKVPLTLLGDLDKRITSHILDTLVSFMHKLKELVDNSLQELPMCFQESWVLTNDVHDIRSDNSFVIFASLHFGQRKQILDNGDQESLFAFFVHRP